MPLCYCQGGLPSWLLRDNNTITVRTMDHSTSVGMTLFRAGTRKKQTAICLCGSVTPVHLSLPFIFVPPLPIGGSEVVCAGSGFFCLVSDHVFSTQVLCAQL